MNYTRYLLPALFLIFMGCKNNEEQADAYGNFEAIEVMVSAEAQGRIVEFNPREGEILRKDQVIVVVDSTQLNLKKKQLQSGVASLRSKIGTKEFSFIYAINFSRRVSSLYMRICFGKYSLYMVALFGGTTKR